MVNRFLLCLSVFALGACAYVKDGSIQDITLETPGAQNAVCYMYVDGLRYKYYPPEKINISKSDKTLEIDCLAPGNRRRKVYIEAVNNRRVAGNVPTGVFPGLAWDELSKSSYSYPSVIQVDFTTAQIKPEAMPAHNAPDIRQPEDYDLEEFRPGAMRLNEDRNREPVEIKPRETYVPPEAPVSEPAAPPPGKGDLMDVLGSLFGSSRSTEPAAGQGEAPANPAYPGD